MRKRAHSHTLASSTRASGQPSACSGRALALVPGLPHLDMQQQRDRLGRDATVRHLRVCLSVCDQLAGAADWRGVAAQKRAVRAVAAAVRTSMPGYAPFVYSILGNTYHSLGDFKKAIEYHTEHLAIAKEVGDRAGRAGRTGTSATGTSERPSSTTRRTWQLQRKEVGDRAGRAGRTRTSASRFSRWGTSARPSSTTRSTWRLQRRWATGRGRAGRTGTSGTRTSRWGWGCAQGVCLGPGLYLAYFLYKVTVYKTF